MKYEMIKYTQATVTFSPVAMIEWRIATTWNMGAG